MKVEKKVLESTTFRILNIVSETIKNHLNLKMKAKLFNCKNIEWEQQSGKSIKLEYWRCGHTILK